jgi:hypothetical protein
VWLGFVVSICGFIAAFFLGEDVFGTPVRIWYIVTIGGGLCVGIWTGLDVSGDTTSSRAKSLALYSSAYALFGAFVAGAAWMAALLLTLIVGFLYAIL